MVALDQIAAHVMQHRLGSGVFDGFRTHFQAEVVRQADGGTYDDGVLFVGQHVFDEQAVDLQFGDGQAAQIAERRIAGAEIVDG